LWICGKGLKVWPEALPAIRTAPHANASAVSDALVNRFMISPYGESREGLTSSVGEFYTPAMLQRSGYPARGPLQLRLDRKMRPFVGEARGWRPGVAILPPKA
jgi:hypothetical protein